MLHEERCSFKFRCNTSFALNPGAVVLSPAAGGSTQNLHNSCRGDAGWTHTGAAHLGGAGKGDLHEE